MSFPTETVLAFLGGSGFFWLLLAGLVLSLALGRYAWRKEESRGTHDIWLGAAAMLACFLAWAVFSVLFHIGKLPPQLWMAPFDRLFVIGCLVALGWALTSTWQGGAQWRRFLIAGLFATVLAYAAWAPLWAREFHSRPWLVGDPTGLTRVWDAWQVVLALAVIIAVLRRARKAPGWVLGALVGLIAASLLELFVPLSPVFPAWSRLGTLVAGTFFVGAAVTQVVDAPFVGNHFRMPGAMRLPSWRPRRALLAATKAIPTPGSGSTSDLSAALTALDSQSETLSHISESVESLTTRVGCLEQTMHGAAEGGAGIRAAGSEAAGVAAGVTAGVTAGSGAAARSSDQVVEDLVAAVAMGEAEMQRAVSQQAPGVDQALVNSLTEALRAPMTMILGYSDLLTRGSGLTDEQLERFLQRIDANLARMQVMLGNLVTVVHEDGEQDTARSNTPEPVDVAKAVDMAVRRARPQLSEKGLVANVKLADDLEPAMAESEAVRRILDNLLVNACQRSPQGGDISIEADVREDQRGARALVVSVYDRGKQLAGSGGVNEIDDSPTSPASLRIVRMLATSQDGGSWSETDQLGARFCVRLPVGHHSTATQLPLS